MLTRIGVRYGETWAYAGQGSMPSGTVELAPDEIIIGVTGKAGKGTSGPHKDYDLYVDYEILNFPHILLRIVAVQRG